MRSLLPLNLSDREEFTDTEFWQRSVEEKGATVLD